MDNLNPRYHGQQEALVTQLREQGIVLIADTFTNSESFVFDKWESDVIADMHRYDTTTTPQALLDQLTTFIRTLHPQATPVWNATYRFSKNSYLLQHDNQPPKGLLGAYFLTTEWNPELYRGELTLAADQPLLIPCQHNALALINREDERLFVKKVTHYAENNDYTLVLVVWDIP